MGECCSLGNENKTFFRTSEFLWQEAAYSTHNKRRSFGRSGANALKSMLNLPKNDGGTCSEGLEISKREICRSRWKLIVLEAHARWKASLQAGTSHFLGQNFSRAFDVKFTNTVRTDYVWATSWGVSTRLMGALIMSHSDDQGLVLPPSLAPIQVVVVPIFKSEEQLAQIDEVAYSLADKLRALGHLVKYDNRTTQNQVGNSQSMS